MICIIPAAAHGSTGGAGTAHAPDLPCWRGAAVTPCSAVLKVHVFPWGVRLSLDLTFQPCNGVLHVPWSPYNTLVKCVTDADVVEPHVVVTDHLLLIGPLTRAQDHLRVRLVFTELLEKVSFYKHTMFVGADHRACQVTVNVCIQPAGWVPSLRVNTVAMRCNTLWHGNVRGHVNITLLLTEGTFGVDSVTYVCMPSHPADVWKLTASGPGHAWELKPSHRGQRAKTIYVTRTSLQEHIAAGLGVPTRNESAVAVCESIMRRYEPPAQPGAIVFRSSKPFGRKPSQRIYQRARNARGSVVALHNRENDLEHGQENDLEHGPEEELEHGPEEELEHGPDEELEHRQEEELERAPEVEQLEHDLTDGWKHARDNGALKRVGERGLERGLHLERESETDLAHASELAFDNECGGNRTMRWDRVFRDLTRWANAQSQRGKV
jgi:hypothetical protein